VSAVANQVVEAVCPVCSHAVAAPLFNGGLQPLATLGWPGSEDEARAMPRHPQDFVQCPMCTHVWNRTFNYDVIPYQKNPMRMFNQGRSWKGHMALTRDLMMSKLPPSPTVIDVGCGDGDFICALAESNERRGRFIGFDVSTSEESGQGVEFHGRYFDPLKDVEAFQPDLILMRHVLEHLTDPAHFLDRLAWAAARQAKPIWFFAELPCIDRALEHRRLADFFYEHFSHFTTESFGRLMSRAGSVDTLDHGYDGEVLFALVQLGVSERATTLVVGANDFARAAQSAVTDIAAQIDRLAAAGSKVAIWGGTGKAAAFINRFGVDAKRFPLVVESDPTKVGSRVPGTGQTMVFRDQLRQTPVDVVIIPTQWRAKDIVSEMDREGISATTVLIEHAGRLIDYREGAHPYR
jgi:hypothetical protein